MGLHLFMRELSLFIFLLMLSAFFSGSETAFFSLSKVRLEKFKKKNRKALQIESLKEEPDYLLSSILLGNMFVNICFSSLITVVFIDITANYGAFVSIALSALLVIIFGEIMPKGIAIHAAEKFALFSSYILKIFSKIVRPFCWFIILISRNIFRWIFRRDIKEEDILTEEELKEALELGKDQGFIEEEEEDMIHSILELSDIEASGIMTPRTEVKAIDIEESPDDVYGKLTSIRHSYVPVFKESRDDIVGVLRTKDYFLNKEKDLKDVMRQPFFVPETKNIGDLLKELITRKEKIAIVVDEYGGFSGIVTQEDIQEEIFGEMYDEYEVPRRLITKVDNREYLIEANIPIRDLNYELESEFPEEEDTLGGFILSLIERFPKEKEVISYKNFEFTVEKATKKRIILVRLRTKK